MGPKWLQWAKELQSIAQAGIAYSKDPYDIERFEQIREMSCKIMADYTDVNEDMIKDLFANETGYATPKVDVRAVVFKEDQILLVKERVDDKWSLPGGWGDIGLTPSEVAVKEVKEESGLEVEANKLIGVLDKSQFPHPPSPYHTYKIFILCHLVGGEASTSIETSDSGFFIKDNLPSLSLERITESQIQLAYHYLRNPDEPAYFD